MAKTTGALLSFGASGAIGQTQVYASWRGVPYARRHVVPANPQTAAQTATRSLFTTFSAIWKSAPALLRAPWTAFSKGRPFTDRNAFIGQNVKAIGPGVDMTDFVASPGANGGLPATSIVVTPGPQELTVALTNPAAPTGWTIKSAVAAAIANTDPHAGVPSAVTAVESTVDPTTVVLPGLTTAQEYQVAAWLTWTKPDGSTAYGTAKLATGTPT